jgi:hypothetical protein
VRVPWYRLFSDKLACQAYEEQAPLNKAEASFSTPRSPIKVPVKSKKDLFKEIFKFPFKRHFVGQERGLTARSLLPAPEHFYLNVLE